MSDAELMVRLADELWPGTSLSEIARIAECDWRTAKKYRDLQNVGTYKIQNNGHLHKNGTREILVPNSLRDLLCPEVASSDLENLADICPKVSHKHFHSEVSVQELADGWNEICGEVGLSQISKITPTRRDKARLRLRENPTQEFWIKTIRNIANSQFCREGRSWCNFDWLVRNDTNCVKAYEGKYNAR